MATSSQLAADVAADISELGGNGVDVGLAVLLVTMLTEPGVCSLGSGGYITVSSPDDNRVWTVDCNMEMPGRTAPAGRFGRAPRVARMAYGGGLETIVGYESVATPGAVAGIEFASRRWGRLPWRELWQPAIAIARTGFPLGVASSTYLQYAHDAVFGWHPDSHAALHDEAGAVLALGATVRPTGRAATLEAIADEGADAFYIGDIGIAMAEEIESNGGLMSRHDLAAYRPILRPASEFSCHGWTVFTNPPPAIGGVGLLAVLALSEEPHALSIEEAQRRVFAYRTAVLDAAGDRAAATEGILDQMIGDTASAWGSPSTVHTSVVDGDGLACAATMSAGYGSGVMPAGTGVWLNNSLGEIELNSAGYHQLRPGTRLASNMAPTIARHAGGAVIGIGSPGADRITSALQQVLLGIIDDDLDLSHAIAAPRRHVEMAASNPTVACEPGAEPADSTLPVRRFDGPDMFFGGVAAAARGRGGALTAAADPRRTGGTLVV